MVSHRAECAACAGAFRRAYVDHGSAGEVMNMFFGFLNLAFVALNAYFYVASGHWYSLAAMVIGAVGAVVSFSAAALR